jgi:hypothetical protein
METREKTLETLVNAIVDAIPIGADKYDILAALGYVATAVITSTPDEHRDKLAGYFHQGLTKYYEQNNLVVGLPTHENLN